MRDIVEDRKLIEIAKHDYTFQTEDIAEYYLERSVILEKHNEILFKAIKKLIEDFESTPLYEDGTHRLIVDKSTLNTLKETLIKVGYKF